MLLLLLLMLLLLPADSLRAEQLLLRYHQFFPHVGHLKQEGKYTMFVQASPITVTPVTVTLFGRPSTVTVGWEGLYVSFGLMGGINMVCCVGTVWCGRLSKMFCNMFSESSTGSWAAAAMLPKQARGTSRKHVTKPFTQPAAPDCSALKESRFVAVQASDGGISNSRTRHGFNATTNS